MSRRAPVGPEDLGVYVHFPWCEKKCDYCDFNSHTGEHDDRRYADAILRELEQRGPAYQGRAPGLRSVFFGGGTPSLWDPAQVARVLSGLEGAFGFLPEVEITLEANPGTVHEGHFEAYARAGVNRFSLGVQSLRDEELQFLGRIHDRHAAERGVRLASGTGARVSLDLIYGLYGQGVEDALYSVERALELGTTHLSAYTLTIEPDTLLGRRTRLGLYTPMDDDAQAELIERVADRLQAAGLHRYEVSNFARPGHESRHNLLYWHGGTYLGLGAGAHSYLPEPRLRGAVRREAVKLPAEYLVEAEAGRFPARFEEALTQRLVVQDRLMVALRTRFGLSPAALDAEIQAEGRLARAIVTLGEELIRSGWLRWDEEWLVPTAQGFLYNDAIAKRMMPLAELVTAPSA